MMVLRCALALFVLLTFGACGEADETPTGRLGVAAVIRAEDNRFAVVDIATGAAVYELEGSFRAASISPDGSTAVAIRADRWPVRIALATGRAEELETKARQANVWQWGRAGNWFTMPLEFSISLISDDTSAGRDVAYPIEESRSTGDIAYVDRSTLVIERPNGSGRIEVPGSIEPLRFVGDALFTMESVDGQPLLRERNSQGELVRDVAEGGGSAWGERAVSPSGTRLLLSSYLGLFEVDLESGARTQLLGPQWAVHAEYIDEDSFLVSIVRNLDPAQDDTPEEAGSLEVVGRDGSRLELFRDVDVCGGGLLSPDGRYAAARCAGETVIYELRSGERIASVPVGRVLGFSADSTALIGVMSAKDGSWLAVVGTAPGSTLRRVVKLSTDDTLGLYQDAVYASAAPWLAESARN